MSESNKYFYAIKRRNGVYLGEKDSCGLLPLYFGNFFVMLFRDFDGAYCAASYGDRVVKVTVKEEVVFDEGEKEELMPR